MPRVGGFLPSINGFRFSNAFPSMPLLRIDLGVAQLPIGDASNGLCGGMVFAARDYFEAGLRPPPVSEPPLHSILFDYLVRRLFDSFNLPVGPARYLYLMNPALPDDESWRSRLRLAPHGRAWVMIKQEWPKIKAQLDRGRLCPLGLIRVKSSDCSLIGQNHQVLAYGYELVGSRLTLHIYDPNWAGNDEVTLSLDLADPYHTTPVTCSPPQVVYCFFLNAYTFSPPPIA